MQEFTASSCWLWCFYQRHSIWPFSLQGEELSVDKPAADRFVPDFQAFVEATVFITFLTVMRGLYYKLLPQKLLVAHFEKSICRWTQDSEGACNHQCVFKCFWYDKAPLIGKSKNPHCFKNVSRDSLPIVYANVTNAALFTDWFQQNFVPMVQEKPREIDCEPKAVLLLNNCSAHPGEEELISADSKVFARFLPPNVTSLIQPMDLVSIKRRYRRKILEFQDSNGTSLVDFLRGIHLLKV